MPESERDPYKVACGARLVLARTALGYPSRRGFARISLENENELAIRRSEDRLAKWENGDALVPPWYVDKLKRLFGISHDFIYSDDLANVKLDLALKIRELQADEAAEAGD